MRVSFISPDGAVTTVEAQAGRSIMQTAVNHGVPGIVGECGGSAMCATCHVYVDEAFVERLPPLPDFESELLGCVAADRRPNSRLSCQIVLQPQLDGIVVHIPETQI